MKVSEASRLRSSLEASLIPSLYPTDESVVIIIVVIIIVVIIVVVIIIIVIVIVVIVIVIVVAGSATLCAITLPILAFATLVVVGFFWSAAERGGTQRQG